MTEGRSAAYVLDMLERHEAVCEHLVRVLHDDLGGLLIAASMDVAWVDRQGIELSDSVRQVLARAREAVGSAITLNRTIIEDLRPTLLDNVGLFAALRWHLRRSSGASGLSFSEHFHNPEPTLSPGASSAVYRVAEDALKLLGNHANTSCVHIRVTVEKDAFVLSISNDAPFSYATQASDCDSNAYLTLSYRIHALHGSVITEPARDGGSVIRARLPLSAMLSSAIPA